MLNPKSEMGQKVEKMAGMQVERIDLGQLVEHEAQIRQLRFNVLAANDNESIHEKHLPTVRRESMKHIHADMRGSGEHEAAYLAKDSKGSVVGFMFIELNPNERHAEIKEMWSSLPEASQKEIVDTLLGAARRDLPEERYPHLHVTASEESKYFKHLSQNETLRKFLVKNKPDSISKPANDGQEHHWREAA